MRIPEADLAGLRVGSDELLRTCRGYVEALTRAGEVLGLVGWAVVSEASGVLLEVGAMSPPPANRVAVSPEPGLVYSLAALGPNPVGLALARASAAVLPPKAEVGRGRRAGLPTTGLAAPIGRGSKTAGCLGVLLPGIPQPAEVALLAGALFSARAVSLALTLREEQSSHLEVAASLAHEVRNPLAAVKGFLQLAQANRDEAPEYAGVAAQELERAIALLEDYSEWSSAQRVTPSQVISVEGLLAEAAVLARGYQPTGPPVTIDFAGSDAGLGVFVDPGRIRQVLRNLCRNAVEAMPQGGVLTLRARRDAGDAVLEVRDTGVGIALPELQRIFDPFYSTKGTLGMGLAISRRIIEAHGGSISVDSLPGRGTTFTVRLPLCAGGDRQPDPGAES